MIPEIIYIGGSELFFIGLAFGVGMPKFGRKILHARYGKSGED